MNEGLFITFEGGEGTGKSTQIKFLSKALEDCGYDVVCIREPGGTKIGESLRDVVLKPSFESMTSEAELFIYEAARAQIVAEVIRPALKRGAVVLCDRFFDSTIAYQVYGRGLDYSFVESANMVATRGLVPNRTVVLSCDAKTGLERAADRAAFDRLESAGSDFHERVNVGFITIAEDNPERVRLISSDGLPSVVASRIFAELCDVFPCLANSELYMDGRFKKLDSDVLGPLGIEGMAENAQTAATRNADVPERSNKGERELG